MWKPKTIDLDKPLYIAIVEEMEKDIAKGILKAGEKLPTHRDMADIIGVNVSTASRAYKEAERRGLISGTVGKGTYISADLGTSTALVALENRAGRIIEMGTLLPLYNTEPDMAAVMQKLLSSRQLNTYLRYSEPIGLAEHREAGAEWVRRFGVKAGGDDIVVCAGVHHALSCCLGSLFKNGDRLAVDCLTYPGIKAIAKAYGIRLEPIQMDGEGMLPESLEAAHGRGSIQGVYIMAGIQNPTTAVMSQKRKQEIAEIIQRNSMILIEDDSYGFTNQNSTPPLSTLIPDSSVYIAGISKAFYAGLRVSFAAAPKQYKYKLANAVLNTIWMTPTLNTAIAVQCIKDGTADRIMKDKLIEIEKRHKLLKEKLDDYNCLGSPTSYFVWLKLPEYWTAKELEAKALENGVNIFCADKFVVGGEAAPNAVRLSLTGAGDIKELEAGLDILKNLLSQDYISTKPFM